MEYFQKHFLGKENFFFDIFYISHKINVKTFLKLFINNCLNIYIYISKTIILRHHDIENILGLSQRTKLDAETPYTLCISHFQTIQRHRWIFLQFLFLKLWDFPASQIRNLPFPLMINPHQQSLETHSQFANLHCSNPSFSFNSMCLSQAITKYNNKSKPITGTMRRGFFFRSICLVIYKFFLMGI